MAIVLKDRVKESTAVTGTGTATLLGTPGDEQSAYGAMARALLDELGQTARQKPFRVE